MRRWKAISFSSDQILLSMMRYFFTRQGGYEIQTYQEPAFCPVWKDDAGCSCSKPCADIIITDLDIRRMSGIELLKRQEKNGCKVPVKNKALIAEHVDDSITADFLALGCAFFEKPVDYSKIVNWLAMREPHFDPSQSLAMNRREERHTSSAEVMFMIPQRTEPLRGIAINMSSSGLCLKTSAPLRQEQTVTIHPAPHSSASQAAVRWAMQARDGHFVTGLQYVTAKQSALNRMDRNQSMPT